MKATTATASVTENRPWRGEFIECAACAYEPPRIVPRMRCPKCFGFRTFHRVVCSGPRTPRMPKVVSDGLAEAAVGFPPR
jgi:hypothetical protein